MYLVIILIEKRMKKMNQGYQTTTTLRIIDLRIGLRTIDNKVVVQKGV